MLNLSEYKELYHYDSKRCLVINELTGVVYMKKTLTTYDESVYNYLKDNKDSHIPEVFFIAKDGNGNLVVIEEVIQGNTFDVLIGDSTISDKDKLKYFLEMLDGLNFLHSAPQPIIHRDLKPSNIMITSKGEVKILDYDAAKIYKPDQNSDTTHLGTEGFAAPEQYGFMQSDPRSDIYAVGKMLIKAFPDNKRIHQIGIKATSFDPNDRYADARELSDALAGKISPSLKLKPLFPPPGFRTRTWWKIMLALIGYPLFIFMIMGMKVEGGSLTDTLYYMIAVGMIVFTSIDIWTSWTGIYDILPFVTSKDIFLRVLFKTIFTCIAGIIIIVVSLCITGVIGLFIR